MVPVSGTNLELSHYLVMVGMALVLLGVAFYWLPATRVKMAALALAMLGGLIAAAALLLVTAGGGLTRKPLRIDDPSDAIFRQKAASQSRRYPASYDPLAARKKAFEEDADPSELSPTPFATLRDQLQKAAAAGKLSDPEMMKVQKGDIVRTKVLRLPTSAVLSVGTQKFCFVKHNEEVEPRELQIGLSEDAFTEVIRGLQEGESVITNPTDLARRLAEGAENRTRN